MANWGGQQTHSSTARRLDQSTPQTVTEKLKKHKKEFIFVVVLTFRQLPDIIRPSASAAGSPEFVCGGDRFVRRRGEHSGTAVMQLTDSDCHA